MSQLSQYDRLRGLQPGGGTLREYSFYVERKADVDLSEFLKRGLFCYIVGPRQMGKSSLCARVLRQMSMDHGSPHDRYVYVNLASIGSVSGSPFSDYKWYKSLSTEIADQLSLADEIVENQFRPSDSITASHCFTKFLRQLMTSQMGQIIILLDEIDWVATLPFCNDFFGALCQVYQSRTFYPEYERLCFGLAGANPLEDLTAANLPVYKEIQLADFTESEARRFAVILNGVISEPDLLIKDILEWTGGHPYLTQKLCDELLRCPTDINILINRLFLNGGYWNEPCFQDVEKRLSKHKDAREFLQVYLQLIEENGMDPIASSQIGILFQPRNGIHRSLCMLGLCKNYNGRLVARNRLFSFIYNHQWTFDALRRTEKPSVQSIHSNQAINSNIYPSGQNLRPFLRKKLRRLFVIDSTFDAFCQDYFHEEAYTNFSPGMDRVAKTNLLLADSDLLERIQQVLHRLESSR